MKSGNFTGIAGIPNQDIAMWEGMGPITDRSQESLGASDVAVAAFRRLMVEAARTMRDSGRALGIGERIFRMRASVPSRAWCRRRRTGAVLAAAVKTIDKTSRSPRPSEHHCGRSSSLRNEEQSQKKRKGRNQ